MSGEATMQKWAVLGNETGVCLQGEVYNHPDHPDGKLLTTPHITRRFLEEDGSVIYVAKNRARFKLGVVNPDYEEDFPGSFERIVQEIKDGVPLVPGAPVGPPEPAPQPAVIIEEKPKVPAAPSVPNQDQVPIRPGTPIPPLIRSTDRLPDVALFWWRPVEPSEKTDIERDTEDFAKVWDDLAEEQTDYSVAKEAFLRGCAAARARKL
jgi:hypothetical protein